MLNILYTSLYIDANPKRAAELEKCYTENIKSKFDKYVYIVHDGYDKEIQSENSIIIKTSKSKPTFNFILNCINEHGENSINYFCNSDIVIPNDSVIKINAHLSAHKNEALALSRWDFISIDKGLSFFNRQDSQDTWVINGKPLGSTSFDFSLGQAGCDNRFAYELTQMGYNVKNLGKSIKTIHHHNSNVRNYINLKGDNIEIVPPPYKFITPQ